MNCWRVTKYNPIYRNQNGVYTRNEWTSISQIGETFNNKKFTIDEYFEIENKYVQAVMQCMEKLNIQWLEVSCMEKYSENLEFDRDLEGIYNKDMIRIYNLLQNGLRVYLYDIENVCRLILREKIWCKLRNNKKMYVHFGYDYYMYIGAFKDCKAIIEQSNISDLYIERFQSPYE